MTQKMRSNQFLQSLDYQLVIWDCKDDFPIKQMQNHILKGFLYLQEVDTDSGACALTLTKTLVSKKEATYLYNWEAQKHFGPQGE